MAFDLCKPASVYLCKGGKEELAALMQIQVDCGAAKMLNPLKRPGSYVVWTDPLDVARAEKDTFICSKKKVVLLSLLIPDPHGPQSDAGPTNNWVDPEKKRAELNASFNGCMAGELFCFLFSGTHLAAGRTMYIIPFSMGHLGSPFSKIGIEISDTSYVAASMSVMTRMGAVCGLS
jgi:phosphoenolpyruvate carboxykinase (GTP)